MAKCPVIDNSDKKSAADFPIIPSQSPPSAYFSVFLGGNGDEVFFLVSRALVIILVTE